LDAAFTDALTTILSDASPQLINRTANAITSGAPAVTLQEFPLNKQVEKLLLEFTFGRNFESSQIRQIKKCIKITKDGTSVINYAEPSWAGSSTNKLLLTID